MGRLFSRRSACLQEQHTIHLGTNAVLRACLQIYVMQVFPATRLYKIHLNLRGENVWFSEKDFITKDRLAIIIHYIYNALNTMFLSARKKKKGTEGKVRDTKETC